MQVRALRSLCSNLTVSHQPAFFHFVSWVQIYRRTSLVTMGNCVKWVVLKDVGLSTVHQRLHTGQYCPVLTTRGARIQVPSRVKQSRLFIYVFIYLRNNIFFYYIFARTHTKIILYSFKNTVLFSSFSSISNKIFILIFIYSLYFVMIIILYKIYNILYMYITLH